MIFVEVGHQGGSGVWTGQVDRGSSRLSGWQLAGVIGQIFGRINYKGPGLSGLKPTPLSDSLSASHSNS